MQNELKKEIKVGIIAAIIITIFFEPIIKWLWGIIIEISAVTYNGFVDAIYKNASLGNRNYIDVIFFFWLVAGLMIFVASLHTPSLGVNVIEKMPTKLKKVTPIANTAFFIILGTLLIVAVFADLQLNTSFQQRLTVLSPAISEQESKEIKAAWANMKNRSDFEFINSKMDNLALLHGIQLPELLLP